MPRAAEHAAVARHERATELPGLRVDVCKELSFGGAPDFGADSIPTVPSGADGGAMAGPDGAMAGLGGAMVQPLQRRPLPAPLSGPSLADAASFASRHRGSRRNHHVDTTLCAEV